MVVRPQEEPVEMAHAVDSQLFQQLVLAAAVVVVAMQAQEVL